MEYEWQNTQKRNSPSFHSPEALAVGEEHTDEEEEVGRFSTSCPGSLISLACFDSLQLEEQLTEARWPHHPTGP